MKSKICLVSLGCDKNLVDSERMLGDLSRAGYELTDDDSQAEILVVNTCCFIGDAKEESINTILELADRKERGACRFLIAAGCLAQRYQQEVLQEMPEVDALIGTASCEELISVIRRLEEGERGILEMKPLDTPPHARNGRILSTGGHYAFLKIAEGCDKHCTYCVIPGIRGRYRSVPMEELVAEAQILVARGVKELILVAQETTLYGTDLYGRKALPELLRKLDAIPGVEWIRIQYCYPEEINDELIVAIRDLPHVCHYLDLPIQHASDPVLKRMGRRTSRADLEAVIGKLRREIPDIAIRTTLITGFPGETEEDFEELMDFVDEWAFDRLGVFPYSQEEDTPAAVMPDQIDEEVKLTRRDEVMELQQEIAFQQAEAQVGRTLHVMVEGYVTDGNVYVGRTYMDAPNVDGYVFLHTDEDLMTGDMVPVKITASAEYDLMGEIDYEFTE